MNKKKFAPLPRTVWQPVRAIAYAIASLTAIPIGWLYLGPTTLAEQAAQGWLAAYGIPVSLFMTLYLSWDCTDRTLFFFSTSLGQHQECTVLYQLNERVVQWAAAFTGIAIGAPLFSWMELPLAAESIPVVYAMLFVIISIGLVIHAVMAIPLSVRTLQDRLQQQ